MTLTAHQHPGLAAPTGAFAVLTEGVQEEATVVVIMEDGFPAIAARHDRVIGPRGLNANAARQRSESGGFVKQLPAPCAPPRS